MKASSRYHQAALVYAGLGWPVFPLVAGSKAPATRHGFADATTDPGLITAWWGDADFNIGVATGPAGLVVIDIDPGAALGKLGHPLPPTLAVRTPRGLHLYYEAAGQRIGCSAGKLGPHIDIRGEGGYVVGAGSVVGGTAYTIACLADPAPLPAWIGEVLNRDGPRITGCAPVHGPRSAAHRSYLRKALTAELQAVATAPKGGRNDRLNRAAWSLGRFVADGTLGAAHLETALLGAARHSGLTATEAARTVRSAFTARGVDW